MANFDPCSDESSLIACFSKIRNLSGEEPLQGVQFVNNYTSNDNFQFKICESSGDFSYNCYSMGGVAIEQPNGHNCFIRIPIKLCGYGKRYSTEDTQYFYMILNNGIDPVVTLNYESGARNKRYEYFNRWSLASGLSWFINPTEEYSTGYWNAFNDKYRPLDGYKAVLDTVKSSISNLHISYINSSNPRVSNPLITYQGMFIDHVGVAWQIEKLPFPVFDLYKDEAKTESNAPAIINYLRTGDDSGSVDPFDPSTPKKTVITNFKTSYKIFATHDTEDKTKTKFTCIAYNNDLIENYTNLSLDYKLTVYSTHNVSAGVDAIYETSRPEKYPTIGFVTKITRSYNLGLMFGTSDDTSHDTQTFIDFEFSSKSDANVSVDSVNRGHEVLSKTSIVDGYRFTSQDGVTVDVLYRVPTMDDLNDGFPSPDDTENDQHGTDSTFSGASGLHTFAINNEDFDNINKQLWSTDWATVFKSSTIDPVKCVISCKSIPFTADNVTSAPVMIANLDTGLTKNYVKSVKSFTTNSVLIPPYNGDFTDITLCKIRCYLPYIGWVELPASECISRVAYPSVGIEAKPKRLGFKYLVDFVDGTVRCVITVNETERWFFDGNCSIDIPVTSDNHTQAVSNALRSGIQTALSIGTAVAGVVSSNAGAVAGGVVGTMQNVPNIFPTYNYTATANGSGYINASMNTHIMLVIERPNVIRSRDYAKRVGIPCGMSLNLGSLRGFTVCKEVDVSGIDATPDELSMIKSLLESGIYL